MHISGYKNAKHLRMVLESVGYNLSNPDTCQTGPALPEGHRMRQFTSPTEQHVLSELDYSYPRCDMLLYCDGDGILHSEELAEHLQIRSTWSHQAPLAGPAPTASDGSTPLAGPAPTASDDSTPLAGPAPTASTCGSDQPNFLHCVVGG